MVADSIVNGDKKMSYYREHTHALASGVDAGRVMGELFAKDGGTCRGAGGSMHVYDKDTHFQVASPDQYYVILCGITPFATQAQGVLVSGVESARPRFFDLL